MKHPYEGRNERNRSRRGGRRMNEAFGGDRWNPQHEPGYSFNRNDFEMNRGSRRERGFDRFLGRRHDNFGNQGYGGQLDRDMFGERRLGYRGQNYAQEGRDEPTQETTKGRSERGAKAA